MSIDNNFIEKAAGVLLFIEGKDMNIYSYLEMCNLIEKYKMGKLMQVSLQRIYVSRNSVYSKQGEIGCKVNIKKYVR